MSFRRKQARQGSGVCVFKNSNVSNNPKGKYHRLILVEGGIIFVSEEALLLQAYVEEISVAAEAQAPTRFFLF